MRVAAVAASFALLITACGGGDGDGEEGDGTEGGGPSGGTFSVNLTEPSYLGPASECYESECVLVLDVVNDPLVSVDENGELVFDGLAEEITTEDNTTWTVKLKADRTFHNGEPINADTLIATWNYTSNPKNEADTAGFMSHIQGAGKGETISGLSKVDDLTVEVTLTGPFSQFGQQMSYSSAFTPMAPACLADTAACNEAPIGSGPYQIDGQWNHDQGITVSKWADYAGDREAQADTIEFTIYADLVAAFRAWQGGTLDVLDALDPTIYAEGVQAAGDRIDTEETADLTYMGFPTEAKPFDTKEYRQAVSQGINREAIIQGVLNGQALPSTDIVTPPIPGSRDDACQYCEFDADAAKEKFEAGGGQAGDTVELWVNTGSGNEPWVEAIGNELKNNLGVNFKMRAIEWAQYLEILDAGNFTGPFRLGWGMDYPSPENYLRPLLDTNGDSNYTGYSNPELDDLLVQGDQAETQEEAFELYQQAGDLGLEDMPLLPLWSSIDNVVWSERVDNVRIDAMRGDVGWINEIVVVQ
jgi:ABC-type transport system substrate-binding protein